MCNDGAAASKKHEGSPLLPSCPSAPEKMKRISSLQRDDHHGHVVSRAALHLHTRPRAVLSALAPETSNPFPGRREDMEESSGCIVAPPRPRASSPSRSCRPSSRRSAFCHGQARGDGLRPGRAGRRQALGREKHPNGRPGGGMRAPSPQRRRAAGRRRRRAPRWRRARRC